MSSIRQVIVLVAAIVVVFALFIAGMWRSGFLTFDGTEPGGQVVAAALALVGAFLAALVSVIGLFLTHANAVAAEQRLQLEASHNLVLQRDAEKRLQLEAAIRAVQLLSTPAGDIAPSIQLSGALFSLASLGQYHLTLSLAFELFDQHHLSTSALEYLTSSALQSGDGAVSMQAIDGLCARAADLLVADGAVIPAALMSGTSGLDAYVRDWLPVLFGDVIAARPLADWQVQAIDSANALIAALCLAWSDETDARIKQNIAAILKVLLEAFPNTGILFHPVRAVDTSQIATELGPAQPFTMAARRVVDRLTVWRNPAGVAP